MTKNKNRQWILNVRPAGRLTGEEFRWNETSIPQPSDGQVLAVENLGTEHGRGIHLMKLAMDEVSFERGGTEVHIRKESGNEQKTPSQRIQNRIVRRLVIRPWPGVRAVELGRR